MPLFSDAVAYHAGDTPAALIYRGLDAVWPEGYIERAVNMGAVSLQDGDQDVIRASAWTLGAGAVVQPGPSGGLDAIGFVPGGPYAVQATAPELALPTDWSATGYYRVDNAAAAQSATSRPVVAPCANQTQGANLQSYFSGGVAGIRGRWINQYGQIQTPPNGWIFYHLWQSGSTGEAGWAFWTAEGTLLVDESRIQDPATVPPPGSWQPTLQMPSASAGLALFPRLLSPREVNALRTGSVK